MQPENIKKFDNLEVDEDLPGLGQFYCIQCDRYFISSHVKLMHTKSKDHKKRVKQLKDDPYSQKEAELAVGLTTDNGVRARMEIVQ